MQRLLFIVAVVGLALTLHPQRAEAAVIHQQCDPTISASSNRADIPLNATLIDGAAWSQIKFQLYSEYYYSSGDASWTCYTRLANDSRVQIALAGTNVMNLSPGESVSDALTFSSGQVELAGYFQYKGWGPGWNSPIYSGTFGGGALVPGYLGLMLNNGTNTYYGWMRVGVTGGRTEQMTLHEWAINLTPGETILVGQTQAASLPQVPLPAGVWSGLGLLGAIVAWRRIRRA